MASKIPGAKIFLALLPLMIPAVPLRDFLAGAFFVLLSVFGATHFFILTRLLFPKKVLHLVLILLAAAVYQTLQYFVSLPALWMASFFFLFDWNDVDPNRLGSKDLPLIPRLAAFAGYGIAIALAQELFAKYLGATIFRQPSGSLALLALGAYLFPRRIFTQAKRRV